MDITGEMTFTPKHTIGGPQGRNSTVWVAHDHQLDAEVAVKQISRAKCASPGAYFAEARRLYFVRHPNVVDVKYACLTPDDIWLAMPYYADGSLHSLLDRRFLTVREIVKLGLDMLAGLHHVHVKRLVHRDVKPANVLMGPNFSAALADFGVADHLDDHGLAKSDSMYDRHLPPEALTVSHVGTHSDIYQAGLTLYRMCNGLRHFEVQVPSPYSSLERSIVNGTFPDRSNFLPHIPRSLRRIVRRALEVDPRQRYETVLDMMNELGAVDGQLDWVYAVEPATQIERWTFAAETYDKVVTLDRRGGAGDVACKRRNRASGRTITIAADSRDGMTRSEAKAWLERILAQA